MWAILSTASSPSPARHAGQRTEAEGPASLQCFDLSRRLDVHYSAYVLMCNMHATASLSPYLICLVFLISNRRCYGSMVLSSYGYTESGYWTGLKCSIYGTFVI